MPTLAMISYAESKKLRRKYRWKMLLNPMTALTRPLKTPDKHWDDLLWHVLSNGSVIYVGDFHAVIQLYKNYYSVWIENKPYGDGYMTNIYTLFAYNKLCGNITVVLLREKVEEYKRSTGKKLTDKEVRKLTGFYVG